MKLGKFVPILLFVGSLIGLLPLALRLANPFATFPWNPDTDARILLLFPDRIELRPTHGLQEFSPRPPTAEYTFLIPRDRQEWVTEQLRSYPTPTDRASWHLAVKSLASDNQDIQLELVGDGFYGAVYEATRDSVVPIKTRLAGPGFAFIVGGIDLAGSVLLLLAFLLTRRLFRGWPIFAGWAKVGLL